MPFATSKIAMYRPSVGRGTLPKYVITALPNLSRAAAPLVSSVSIFSLSSGVVLSLPAISLNS